MLMERPHLRCAVCGREPKDIGEYQMFASLEEMTPDEYVWLEEGTLNRKTGQFVCTDDYLRIGSPSSPRGWTVPDEGL